MLGFPGGSDSKESAYNSGDLGSIPGRSPAPAEGSVGLTGPEPGEDAGVEVAPGPAAAEHP